MYWDELKDTERAAIDLHGQTVFDAEESLLLFLEHLPKHVKAVAVTHGYSHGRALKRLVKEDFYYWRVQDKRVGLNPGVTYLMLK